MPKFPNAVQTWRSDAFNRALKDEIEHLEAGTLPLYKETSRGGLVDDADITAMVLTSSDDGKSIVADVGVFFTEIVASCSCGDEPDEINAYCQLQIRIDKASTEAEIRVVVPD